jgi:hypothetical protein
MCCYNLCHGNVVEICWSLWDNIYDLCVVKTFAMEMQLRYVGPYEILFMMYVLLKPLPWTCS